jgi:hypothetical protein
MRRKSPLYALAVLLHVLHCFIAQKKALTACTTCGQVFGFTPLLWTKTEQALSDAMQRYWTTFAATTAPGKAASPF